MKYWNSTDAIFSWRKSWEEHANQALERAGIPERVDCRSYQAQGLDDIAGIHLGPHGAKQTDSQQYQINEDIKKLNKKNQEIRQALGELETEIKQKNDQLYESIAERMGWLRGKSSLPAMTSRTSRHNGNISRKQRNPYRNRSAV